MACLKRAMVAFPILVLLFFGALHILQVLIGRAWLFWDLDAYDEFMPNWGKSGHSGGGLKDYPTDATRDVLPIPCHSHNDYWRRVPMFDAIHWGCTSIEADVWNFDEELYIGHDLASLTRNRTLQNLYINPLVDLLDKMNPKTDFTNAKGHGVFDADPQQTLVLLIDFKTKGHSTFPLVSKQLEALREKDYLTFWDGIEIHRRAVTVVGTGNTPFDLVVNSTTHRDIFFDAPLDKMWELPRDPISSQDPVHNRDGDLDYGDAMALPSRTTPLSPPSSGQGRVGIENIQSVDDFSPENSYYASTSFTRTIGFVWRGHLSPRQMDIIRGQIRGAKRRGLKARYWDTPSWPIALRNHVWHVLMKEGADVLNVDDLRAAAVDTWKLRVHDWFN
ncbi:hypothetical protein EJ03DRAFT_337923 [Teratosphaeria nubilosa]|uniref:Altered inheritance of mitochondria protein 6 n=1 Tax=Teratosphaeria nubilosa TaxID=161662 RepID=A0A6G1L3D8_9PEZI|nr:hypothetical protein EJ03DRAFT_337923 [Teratosphaeria nubilosa]